MLWLLCVSECKQTKHTSCWSFRQKSFNVSERSWQSSPDSDEALSGLFNKKSSHTFFSARFWGGSNNEDSLLHTGHSVGFPANHLCQQALQKLWPHNSRTGCWKISWQIGQDRFDLDSEEIFSLSKAPKRRETAHQSVEGLLKVCCVSTLLQLVKSAVFH